MKQFTLIVAAAMLSACGSGDKEAPASDTARQSAETANDMAVPVVAPATPTDAAGYIAKAGAGDLWEIQSSQALLGKSTRDDVKAFARMMVDNHGKSTAKVKAAAAAASIKVPPPALDADQQRALDEIKNASAADVDAVYLRNQRTAHDAALALHRTYATGGDTDSLKKAASEIVPVVEKHIAELQKLAAPAETNNAR
jgi:putative membrane protein